MNIRKVITAGAIALMLPLSACGFEWPGPCDGARQPTQQDLDAAANGYEVEDAGCELSRGGEWVVDD